VPPASADALPAVGNVAGRRSIRAVGSGLFALTKPRIIELLLVTTIPTMLLAERGLPSVRILLVTLAGGALAAGSANTINCYIDRDIDALMRRTSRRPLARPAPMAVVKPFEALLSGIILGAAATVLLGTLVNWLSAILADGAILFYVFVYTIGLKRRTASNIVIGGAAGCFPVLVGWSAVTGTVAWPAIVLFGVIFFWTPPHFWALAMKFRDDYARASVPMLPVVAPASVVARKILVYSYIMVVTTLALAPYAGWLYTICAAGLGAWFLVEAHRLYGQVARADEPASQAVAAISAGATAAVAAAPAVTGTGKTAEVPVTKSRGPLGHRGVAGGRSPELATAEGTCAGIARPSPHPAPMRLFHLSIAYLTLLFAAIAVVSLLPVGRW
jgi:protoheme IX farnesyltransferase